MAADGSVIIDTKLDGKGAEDSLKQLDSAAEKSLSGVKIAVAAAAAAVVAGIGDMLKKTGELEQNLGGANQVFAEFADNVKQKGQTAFKDMGLSASDFLATANKMGALFQGSGFGIEESADLATKAMQRASDVASIMGIDVSAAMEAVAGAAKGNFT